MTRLIRPSIIVASAIVGLLSPVRAWAASCESLPSLAALTRPDATMTAAQVVAAGAFTPPSGRGGNANSFADLPAFCRVTATLKPSSDSDIKIEVWLPAFADGSPAGFGAAGPASADGSGGQAAGWNGKFQGVGNGGWAGAISYAAMAAALRKGYATSSTDTGHVGGSGSFALGHPEKLTDFAYRSVHEMTVTAKAIISAYYSKPPAFSYWNGCSTGGRQGLKEAQRFPDDYNGIVAGAPANNWTRLTAHQVAIVQAARKVSETGIPPAKHPLVHRTVLEMCDATDGVADGVLENPSACKFDPGVLLCKGADDASCLTAAEVALARTIYAGSVNSRTKEVVFPGLMPGTERRWEEHIGPDAGRISLDYWKYVVFADPQWSFTSLNLDSDVARADKIDSGQIAATDPDLKAFFARGGKLIQYHGWNDPQISPLNSLNYYKSVASAMGGVDKVDASYRLFMAPGMAHCGGGEGPSDFDKMAPLEEWVEKGKAPASIVASHSTGGRVDRTRPLCSYPQLAHFTGTGSSDDASNFVCKAPEASVTTR